MKLKTKKILIALAAIVVLTIAIQWLRPGGIVFGPRGLMDSAYHRQTVVSTGKYRFADDVWTSEKPYLCYRRDSGMSMDATHCSTAQFLLERVGFETLFLSVLVYLPVGSIVIVLLTIRAIDSAATVNDSKRRP